VRSTAPLWFGLLAMLALASAGTGGCISRTITTTVSEIHTTPVGDPSWRLIRDGQTTRKSLLERFGPPSGSLRLQDGNEVLFYSYRVRQSSSIRIPLILARQEVTTKFVKYSFELSGDTVVRHWREEH